MAATLALVQPRRQRAVQGLWATGAAFLWLHILSAFHFQHRWSLHAAVEHTTHRSLDIAGLAWEGAIALNFLFAIGWTIDATYWPRSPGGSYALQRGLRLAWRGFFCFMVINGAIIFERGPTRWIVSAFLFLLAFLWLRRERMNER